MFLKRVIKKIFRTMGYEILKNGDSKYRHISYSQTGEDLIVRSIFNQLNIFYPKYLDLGAHHPIELSNTFHFYKSGCTGVNVEPDPYLIKEFNKVRPKDKNLNIGVGFDEVVETANFYVMDCKPLNTFSKEEALKIESYGTYKIQKVLSLPLLPIAQILESFEHGYPNFVSLDIEGWDFQVIKTFDFNKCKPEVFCIETLTYTENKAEEKLVEIINYMLCKGYFVYADTYLNTIFVDKDSWMNRP